MEFDLLGQFQTLPPLKQHQCRWLAKTLEEYNVSRISTLVSQSGNDIPIYNVQGDSLQTEEFFPLNSEKGFQMILEIIEEKCRLFFPLPTKNGSEITSTDKLLIYMPSSLPEKEKEGNEQPQLGESNIPMHVPIAEKIESNRIKECLDLALPKMDYWTYGQIHPGENVNQVRQMVLVVQCVLEAAKLVNVPIIYHHGNYYVYTGKYYERIPEPVLKTFLSESAIAMGVASYMARYYQFKDNLTKQFESQAYFPLPPRIPGETLINLDNGVIVINSSGVRLDAHNPEQALFYILKYSYDPDAKCPKWQEFLDEVLPDKSMQMVLAEFVASVFISNHELKLEKALILYGGGANGKSVVHQVLCEVLGQENVSNYSLRALVDEKGYYRSEIAGKLLNWASEISATLSNTAMFKALASGEPVEARRPYGNAFILTDIPKLAFNTNVLPKDAEMTSGFFRRFIIIPFEKTIPVEKRNPKLAQEIIQTELPGIFNWVLEGLHRLIAQKGFTHSAGIDQMVDKYRKQSDSVALFIEDIGLMVSTSDILPLKEIYDLYRDYCKDNGLVSCSNRVFSERLGQHGFTVIRRNYGRIVYATR
ncbi:MAG: phage/plasmid primase, P4 family [bacterium]